MSKFIRSLIVLAMSVPGLALAAGYYASGSVYVSPNSYMQGTMNVRWNASAPGTPYMYATGYAGSYVGFFGYDGSNSFSCYVSTTNPIYAQAVDIKNSLTNGGRLYVTKNADSSECTNVFLGNYSYFQS
ncbi:MAG TPA: hypothetical protein VFX02_04090 [Gammaproteobacteria bacterium]|nr:hypothetical protein [Gammaproteobacteria bacterium]